MMNTMKLCATRRLMLGSSPRLNIRSTRYAILDRDSSSASAPRPKPDRHTPEHDRLTTFSPDSLNPPSTTRPPALSFPARELSKSAIAHYISIGRIYVKFYKTGLKNIRTNHRLLKSLKTDPPQPSHPDEPPAPPRLSRAHLHLHERHRHDITRLPLFGLLLLVCGEFTPLVVLALPSVVPYTCRIPKQVDKLLRKAEERRRASLERVRAAQGERGTGREKEEEENTGNTAGTSAASLRRLAHAGRALGVFPRFADTLGGDLWARFFPTRVIHRCLRLMLDDALLRTELAPPNSHVVDEEALRRLVPEELRLTCAARGMDVRGRHNDELRRELARWLEVTRADGHKMIRDGMNAVPEGGWGEANKTTVNNILRLLERGGLGGGAGQEAGHRKTC